MIDVEALREIAAARLTEAQRLLEKEHFAGAMFLGGCSLECYLKVAICVTLKLEGLPEAFKTHDLEALLLYSGYRSDLEAKPPIEQAFIRIVEEWQPDGRQTFLYGLPSHFDKDKADVFFNYLLDSATGVIP